VADTGNAAIRKIAPDGTVSTLAGSATNRGNQDGTGANASFSSPGGVAVDSAGNVYVADAFNQTIRKITSAGAVTTLAGSPGSRGEADGTGGAAQFNHPLGVAVDGSGNLYVADTFNDTIRKITPAGGVTTLAGSAGISGGNDGTGIYALFNQPVGVAVDGSGNVFVADTGNATIRRVTPNGVVTTLAGIAGIAGLSDGVGANALFNQPHGVALDGAGNVYVADTGNAAIRKITSNGTVTTVATTPANTVAPTITIQPEGATAMIGSAGTFFAAASGSPEPTFQWRKDGVNIAGATSSSYTIINVVAGDAGIYTVVATNSAGSAISNGAVLTISGATTGTSTVSGGGGSLEAWFVGTLVLLGMARWMARKS
jgi:sugar lactone lactonase YvrE